MDFYSEFTGIYSEIYIVYVQNYQYVKSFTSSCVHHFEAINKSNLEL